MTDVVVDAKPKPQLPYDPESIPPAVKKRVAAVEALYGSTALATGTVNDQHTNGSGAAGQTVPAAPESSQHSDAPVTPQEPVQSEMFPPTAPTTPAPADSSPPSPGDEQNWKRQALAWEGRYKATVKTVDEMQEQMVQLGNELLQTQRLLKTRPNQQQPQYDPTPPPAYVTEQDVQNYGGELIDLTRRAALDAVVPHLQTLEAQNAELRQQLAKEARHSLDQIVESAVPNYREIDRDPRWHRWLMGIDLYTGRVRQTLLDEAITAASAPRVISFFRGFLNEEVATGHMEPVGSPQAAPPREPAIPLSSLAAPGRARPAGGSDNSLPPDKPIYTRVNIRDLYSAHRKGAYIGREAEWNRIEADLFAAQRDGRVQG
jgi:hypothetical protein